MGGGEVVGEADQRVLKGGEVPGADPAVAVLFELLPGFCLRLVDQRAQAFDQGSTQRRILAQMRAGEIRRLVAQEVEAGIGRFFRCSLVHGKAIKNLAHGPFNFCPQAKL